ncbi:MAG: ATP-binding protein [Candidatus Diapherotrites archaeon]|nr:ATP-binding protein [Candidatus Diapherotrites archaeon]
MQINLEEIEKQEGSPFVEKFEEFFNSEYRKEIEKILENYPEKRSVVVDFKLLERFDPALADELTDNPDAIIAAAQSAIKNVNIPSLNVDSFEPHIRFSNLPADSELNIRDIGSKHLGKFISVEGVARLITDVLPKIKLAVWKCKRCGNIYKTPQEKQNIKMPNMCECNHRDFELIEDKSDFVDYQKVQIQEPLDKLKGSEQAAHIDVYIMDDLVNKVSGGDKTRFSGVLRLSPPDKEKKSVYRWFLETNYLDETQKEFDEIDVSKEDEEEIRKLAKNPLVYDMLKDSIAPAIYGHDVVKESIGLQLFSGVTKHLPNNQKIRGNIHILLIGDPGCLVGDERVVMGDGTIKRIEDLGENHLQKVDFQILTGEGGKKRDSATTFFYYPQKKVMEIITESGKSIKGTHDHPLLCVSKENGRVKREWKRLDNFKIKDKVAVVTGIPCTITKYVPTGFKKTESTSGPKFKGKLPEKVTPELGALLGYMLGDGWVRKKEAYFVVSDPEKDLLPKLEKIVKDLFGIAPGITSKKGPGRKVILHRAGIHSKDVAHNLLFLREKRVPKIILESGNKVVAEFLKWLYEADGCVFSKGRGSRSISLKAKNLELLRDVQILLLRFSIHSRIIENSLMIRRGKSIKKFATKIGFASKKKKEKMNEAAKNAEKHARLKQQRSEKIVKIIDHGLEDVYDIEVPQSHRFIANGIISHNCGKSQLLLAANSIAPKSIYVGGKTTSGVGLTASAVKDDFGEGGWTLKAGALVLSSGGICMADELDKMTPEDRSALHEAMEQGTISVAKAGIVARFKADTSLLAAANPKHHRFDKFQLFTDQIDLPPSLISRFDLFFMIKDILDRDRDKKISEHILMTHQGGEKLRQSEKTGKPLSKKESDYITKLTTPIIDGMLLRKYVSFARQTCFPVLSPEAIEKITDFYIALRDQGRNESRYAATARQLEGLVRLAEASAKVRLSDTVTIEDAERSIRIVRDSLQDTMVDPETGKIDIDIATSGTTHTKQNSWFTVLKIIKDTIGRGEDSAPLEMIIEEAGQKGLTPEKVKETIKELESKGEIYSPRYGLFKPTDPERKK